MRRPPRSKQGLKEALVKGLVRSLVIYGSVTSTEHLAKVLKQKIDRIITVAKKDNVFAKRSVLSTLGGDKETAGKLFKNVLPRLTDRTSGFTRLVRLGTRRGDRSMQVKISWAENSVKNEEAKPENSPEKPAPRRKKVVEKESK